jgi:uncharacterized protein YndB with AHSA1/START domain
VAVSHTLDLKAPIEKVFDLIDDKEKLKLWMDGLEDTVYTSDRDPANPVGTRFRQKIKEGGRVQEYDGEVLAYEKPKHLAVRIGNKQFSAVADYRLTPTPDGTRLDYTCEVTPHGWLILVMLVVFGWVGRRILRKQMAKLKELAER